MSITLWRNRIRSWKIPSSNARPNGTESSIASSRKMLSSKPQKNITRKSTKSWYKKSNKKETESLKNVSSPNQASKKYLSKKIPSWTLKIKFPNNSSTVRTNRIFGDHDIFYYWFLVLQTFNLIVDWKYWFKKYIKSVNYYPKRIFSVYQI